MSTTEIAEIAVERVDGLGFQRWAAVRRCALCLYAAVLVVWSATYGVPVQRELVIAWVCGALVCVSIGREPRQILQLALDWLPIVAILLAYDFTRGAADSVGIDAHVHPMIDFDRFVFFGADPDRVAAGAPPPARRGQSPGTSASPSSTPPTSSSPSSSPASSGPATGPPSSPSRSGS